MSPRMTDEQHKKLIMGHFDMIEKALSCARAFMREGKTSDPAAVTSMDAKVINLVFNEIERYADAGRKLRWPDPAAMAAEAVKQNAAKRDVVLQKLIKRASKPTPIRASKPDLDRAHDFAERAFDNVGLMRIEEASADRARLTPGERS